MSHRMCAKCNNVVDNKCWNDDICPQCNSNNWADPTEHNNEWSIIYKYQTKNIELQGKLDLALKQLEITQELFKDEGLDNSVVISMIKD